MTERNTDRLLMVADLIEKFPEIYDQTVWVEENKPVKVDLYGQTIDCGTNHCIAGWGVVLAQGIEAANEIAEGPCAYVDFHNAGADALGLSNDEARQLFSEMWSPNEGVTVSDALRAIAFGASIDSVTAEWLLV